MPSKPTWLEAYKKNGEWKLANGRTGQVLRTFDTKRELERMVGSYMGSGNKYYYVGVQFYQADGGRGDQRVSPSALKSWVRAKSSMTR
jgi:hypothetical protein